MLKSEKDAAAALLLLFTQSGKYQRESVFDSPKPPKRYKCPTCNERFTQSGSLGTHVRVKHKNIRPYRCPRKGCLARPFGQRGDLNRHIASVHDGKKDHKCLDCSEYFSRKSALNRHRERKHRKPKQRNCSEVKIKRTIDKGRTVAY